MFDQYYLSYIKITMDDIRLPKLSKVPFSTVQEAAQTPETTRELLHRRKTLLLDDISINGSEIVLPQIPEATTKSLHSRKNPDWEESSFSGGSDILQEVPQTPEAIRKLLQPRKKLDLDEISFSGSEISDAFADIGRDVFKTFENIPKPKKKHDIDLMIMANFTEDFKETMQAFREELKLGKDMTNETDRKINKILNTERETVPLPESVQQRIDELLKDTDYMCSTPSQTSDDESPVLGLEAMSEFWKMLTIDENEPRFQTSPPGYNAYAQEPAKWREDSSVPWEALDFSKYKCEAWLNEQEDDST